MNTRSSFIFSSVTSGLWLADPLISLAAAEALAAQVSQGDYDRGLIYPPFCNIRKISAHIAANVAAKAYQLGEPIPARTQSFKQCLLKFVYFIYAGLASRLPRPENLVQCAESSMYNPAYRSYR